MGLIERWNKLAQKNIYVNKTWEIGVGRLVFSFLIMLAEFAQAWIITGNPYVFFALLLTLLVGLKKQDKIDEE